MSNSLFSDTTKLTKAHAKDLLSVANLCDKLSIRLSVDPSPISEDERIIVSVALVAATEMLATVAGAGCCCAECENERDSASQ